MQVHDRELEGEITHGSALAVPASSALSVEVRREVAAHKRKPRTKSTVRAYALDWRRFTEWCSRENQIPCPASEDTIIAFLISMGKVHMPASLERAYAAIRVVHELKGETLPRQPSIINTIQHIRRKRADDGLPNVVKKRALEAEQVLEAASKLPDTLAGRRDRVVLLFGWAIAQRRADIAAVRVQDVRPMPWGLEVTIPRSKTNQDGKPFVVAVHRESGPGCPVAAVEAWLKASGIVDGRLIRRIHKTGNADPRGLAPSGVAAVAKAAAKALGLDPREYGGHSLRRGFVTSAAKSGKQFDQIMGTTGHRDPKTVIGYVDDAVRVERAAGKGLLSSKAESIEVRGQVLVKSPKLRFEKAGTPVESAWVRTQAKALEARGCSKEQTAELLRKISVTWAGRPVEARDF